MAIIRVAYNLQSRCFSVLLLFPECIIARHTNGSPCRVLPEIEFNFNSDSKLPVCSRPKDVFSTLFSAVIGVFRK